MITLDIDNEYLDFTSERVKIWNVQIKKLSKKGVIRNAFLDTVDKGKKCEKS